MRIASLRLKNFKRFTDLVIRAIPETAKLVVVVGPNGCGKSSLFDALLSWYRSTVGFGVGGDEPYFRKSTDHPFQWNETVNVVLHGNAPLRRGSLYVRTAYRNDPDFSISAFSRPNIPSETPRIGRVIENDQTVSENYQRLVYDTMAGVYDPANAAKTVQSLREELIGQIRASMKRVFDDLVLNSISDPLGDGAFFFEKGAAKSYHYKNLSGGEKAAFDLLLDLHVKRKFFADAVYCIDEVEAHLHTRVQGTLLREIVEILPAEAQLWVTTHSLGVLRAAHAMAISSPGTVCVIEFDGVQPDLPQELVPSNLGRVSWEKWLSVTLDDLSTRVAPRVVVVCEGSSIGTRRKDFDAEIYNRVLGSHSPDVLFVSGGPSNQILASGVSIREALGKILPASRILALADRDDKSSAEVAEWEKHGDIVLSLRNLESFLLSDEVIGALVVRENKQALLADALKVKQDAVDNSVARRNQPDDLKSAAGEIYTNLKRVLGLQQCGNDSDAFMRDTLAPLIVPGMATFDALKAAVLERVP